jgi:archaeosortase C (PEF-CTERM variant)
MNKRLKDWRVLLGAILVITGLDLLIMFSKLPAYVGILFLLPGALILLYVFKDDINKMTQEDKYGLEEDKYVPIIGKLTFDGLLVKLFPLAGILAIVLDLLLNQGKELGSFDTVILLWGGMMIAYQFVPNKLYRERDFVLIFLTFILLILVLPATLISRTSDSGDYSQSSMVYYLLAVPMIGLLNLFGLEAHATGPLIEYELQAGGYGAVFIATSCAGIYSMSIFISAFIAFVFIEYNKFDRYVTGFLGLGVALAWFANILRMTIIVMVGSYYGREALLWTHKYLGEIIFIAWTAVFWMILFKYMPEPEEKDEGHYRPVSRGNGLDEEWDEEGDEEDDEDFDNKEGNEIEPSEGRQKPSKPV